MKRFLTLFAAAAALFSCSHDEAFTPNTPTEKATYYASFADAEGGSRTYLDDEFKLLWHNDDRISLFTTTYNEEYKFADPTGSNAGKFEAIDNDSWVTGNPVSTTYAVYPYNEHNALSNSEVLTIYFPAEQAYAEKSFGRGANTMVAAAQSATSRLLPFRNAGGYLMLKLYGEGAVKSITLEGNNDEILSGAATAQAKYGYLPLITMGNEGGKTITLTCEEAVELGATEAEATVFWLVVPPITFEEGFTITVTDDNGGTYTKSTSKELVIERNEIKSMSALNPTFEGETEDPEVTENMRIRYTASKKLTPFFEGKHIFGAEIVSNEWDETTEQGVITFDGEVTRIGELAFANSDWLDRSCRTISIPESVTTIGMGAFSGRFCDSLYIPKNVQQIESHAFSYNHSLYFSSDTPVPFTDFATTEDNNISVERIYVPYQKLNTYRESFPIYNSIIFGYDFEANKMHTKGLTYIRYSTIDNQPLALSNPKIVSNDYSHSSGIIYLAIPNNEKFALGAMFKSCGTLSRISSMPTNITSIGDKAFFGCTNLTKVALSANITTIGASAFEGCANLQQISIPNSTISIGEKAFDGCSALKEVFVPESIESIGQSAFNNCGGTASINCNVGSYWFANAAFTSVTFGDGVTVIGESAFSGCSALTQVQLPSNLQTIGRCAFQHSPFSTIEIPASTTSIGLDAFSACNHNAQVFISDLEAWCKIDFESPTANPLGHLYLNGELLEEVVLPKIVNNRAFYGCKDITTFTIPADATEIAPYAFEGCSGKIKIGCNLPNSVGLYMFKHIEILDGVTKIESKAFQGCIGLESITIGNSVSSIGEAAFQGCTALTSVHISDLSAWCKVDFLGQNSNPFSSYQVPAQLYHNGNLLEHIVIPEDITVVKGDTFRGCDFLKGVTIPDHVQSIEESAFNYCENLENLTIGNGVTTISKEAFKGCSKLVNVTLGENISTIGYDAFCGCSSLAEIIIPESVTSIDTYAFLNCDQLSEVTIPKNVQYIGDQAFSYCDALATIYCVAVNPPTIGSGIFMFSPCHKIYVPSGSLERYKTASGWSEYKYSLISY